MSSIFHGKKSMVQGRNLMGLIREKALLYPEKEAVSCGDVSLTYTELLNKVVGLAEILKQHGLQNESKVGIYMSRSEKTVVAILAVLEAGGAYVPLDPQHPADRNGYIIEKSKAKLIISEEKYKESVPGTGEVLCIDMLWDKLDGYALKDAKESIMGGNQLAYVIFTSGSTGNPKGVQVEHGGMVNYLLSVSENLGLDDSVRGLAVVTITFDISISELFLPLINGGTLVMADNTTAKDGMLIAGLMEKKKINLCGFTPSTMYMLLDAGKGSFEGVKFLIGGEPWSITLAKDVLRRNCSQLWNVYGPTETTIYSAMARITEDDEVVSIGQPIAGTDLYILDENRNEVGNGCEGELYIGGVGVARGYFENEALTDKSFIKNPFDTEAGRIYKTGDIVSLNQKNQIVYVGRSDFQVKVHGYRIELGEIETALSSYPAVEQAVAVVAGTEKDAVIKAFVKCRQNENPDIADIRAFMETKVPSYMIPGMIIPVDEYPMTPNLKVDRKALIHLETGKKEDRKEFIAPRNEIEEGIAELWSALLGMESISVNDDFLELGGHSLLANRLVIKMNKEFGTTVTLVDLFSRPMTIEEMALLVEDNLLAGLSEEELNELLNEDN